MKDLIEKYNIPAPRYTSYPTVPYWDQVPNETDWQEEVKRSFIKNNSEGISLYIHLPFCESLCTYCACNTRITVNHRVEQPYIEALIKEWELYLGLFSEKPLLRELHLGGGTPTFFAAENLRLLLSTIFKSCDISPAADFSFEGHPSNTTELHLRTLYKLGFRRVSFGVQDFDANVQEAINRYQSPEEVQRVMEQARLIGYTSVNVDLVYGLPYQSLDSVKSTIARVIALKPERIAFYSYAHVPWLKPGQRRYTEADLPLASEKRALYEAGKELFAAAGYTDIGMDHFALPGDDLLAAFNNRMLHRNFMGYTTSQTKLLIGLGCSAISDSWGAFAQNIKTVEEYTSAVYEGKFPLMKGHLLNAEDLCIRQHILNLMCRHESDFSRTAADATLLADCMPRLEPLLEDGLIHINDAKVCVSDQGRLFLRNICLAFDKRYWARQPQTNLFSTTA